MSSTKVGFGFAKKKTKDENLGSIIRGEEKKDGPDYITGMSGNSLESVDPSKTKGPNGVKIIPRIENTFQVGVGKQKQKKELYLPDCEDLHNSEDRFEKAAPTSLDQSEEKIQYGLTKRQRPSEKEKEDKKERNAKVQRSETEVCREDTALLPEACGLEDYEAMPIEAFGEAMLRGMGWQGEGTALGKNAKGLVTPVEYVPRQQRLGLGAQPAAPQEDKRKVIKSGESRIKADLILAPDADGKVRHVKSLDEKLVERVKKGVHPGKVMVIISGQHRGMKAKVVSVETPEGRSERASVELLPSSAQAVVRSKELAELDSVDAEEALKEHTGKGHKQKKEKKEKSDRHEKHKHKESSKSRVEDEDDGEPQWLRCHIRVKIIDKKLEGGKFYLKKAEVVDVSSYKVGSVILDDGKMVSNIAQRHLETALPKKGGRVVILLGKFKGQRGKLIDRLSETGEGVVQLNDDFSLQTLALDSFAEYLGAEDDED